MATKKRLADINPVAIALKARSHREELLETRVADLMAIVAFEDGTVSGFEILALCFMVNMTRTCAGPN